ncbi:MAG: ABC transporter permease [Candidatus Eremiobacterota bacterium]
MIFLRLAFRNVLRNKERSLLTLIGVLLAVGSFVALLSLAEGLFQRVSSELRARSVHIYVLPYTAAPLPTGPVGTLGLTSDTIPLEYVSQINAIPQVQAAGGIIRQSWTGRSAVLPVVALDPALTGQFFPELSVQGNPVLQPGQVWLGRGLAANEGLGQGATLQNGPYSYPVVGLAYDRFGGFQDYFVYLPLETAILQTNARGVQEIWVRLRDPGFAPDVAGRINQLGIPGARALTQRQYLGVANDYVRYVWLLQFCISAIGVLIAMTAAMNTMLMSTYERLREFATLRAIGASRLTVVLMLLAESVILSLAGGVLGIFFGWLASFLLDRAVLVLFKLSFPMAEVTWMLALESVLLTATVGVVGAVLPSIIVWRIKIVDGLRWD